MIRAKSFFRFFIPIFSTFCAFLLALFLLENMDAILKFVGIRKTFSGRILPIRVAFSVLLFSLLLAAFFFLFRALYAAILRKLPALQSRGAHLQADLPRIESRLIVVLSILSLAVFVLLGCYFRKTCDDFDFLKRLSDRGLWGAIVNHYYTWSGRYMQFPPQVLLANIPERILFPGFTLLMICAWYYAISGFFRHLLARVSNGAAKDKSFIIGLSSLVICAFLLISPSLFTSLYWYIGGVTFALGIAGQLISLYALFRYASAQRDHAGWLLLALAGTFVANGTNELTAISMLILSIFFVAFNPYYSSLSRARQRGLWLYAIVSLICLVFMISAPGNFVRMSHADHLAQEGVLRLLTKFILNMFSGYGHYLATILSTSNGLAPLFFVMFFIVGTQTPLDAAGRRLLNWLALLFFVASFGCIATNAYLYNYLPLRSMTAITILFVLFGVCAMLSFGSRYATATHGQLRLLFCTLCCFICASVYLGTYWDKMRTFAREADYRDAQLSVADRNASVVKSCRINYFFGELYELESDPDFIINRSVADYYGLKNVVSSGNCADLLVK